MTAANRSGSAISASSATRGIACIRRARNPGLSRISTVSDNQCWIVVDDHQHLPGPVWRRCRRICHSRTTASMDFGKVQGEAGPVDLSALCTSIAPPNSAMTRVDDRESKARPSSAARREERLEQAFHDVGRDARFPDRSQSTRRVTSGSDLICAKALGWPRRARARLRRSVRRPLASPAMHWCTGSSRLRRLASDPRGLVAPGASN